MRGWRAASRTAPAGRGGTAQASASPGTGEARGGVSGPREAARTRGRTGVPRRRSRTRPAQGGASLRDRTPPRGAPRGSGEAARAEAPGRVAAHWRRLLGDPAATTRARQRRTVNATDWARKWPYSGECDVRHVDPDWRRCWDVPDLGARPGQAGEPPQAATRARRPPAPLQGRPAGLRRGPGRTPGPHDALTRTSQTRPGAGSPPQPRPPLGVPPEGVSFFLPHGSLPSAPRSPQPGRSGAPAGGGAGGRTLGNRQPPLPAGGPAGWLPSGPRPLEGAPGPLLPTRGLPPGGPSAAPEVDLLVLARMGRGGSAQEAARRLQTWSPDPPGGHFPPRGSPGSREDAAKT